MKAIINGKVFTVTGQTFDKATVLVDNGKIKAVGPDIELPEGTEVIDASGCWVTPGLIDCHTHICNFSEPNSLPGLSDGNEMTGPIQPHIRAMDAVYPDDYSIVPVREAGFTTVYSTPGSGNVIGGTGISIKLRGHTVQEMAIPGSEQMKFAFGENPKRNYGARKQTPQTRMGLAGLLRETLFNAKNYSDALLEAETDPSKAPKPDYQMQALVPVIRGQMRCRMHAHRSDDILTAISIAEEYHLDYSMEHCTEGHMIVDALKRHNVRCTIGPYLWQPYKQELWNMKMENPAILANAGVPISLTADTGSQTAYLPATLGLLMRRGLSEQSAFEGITINPARTLQLEDRVGSLEEGKDADIAIFDGHPFSSLSACRMTIIDGKIVHDTLTK